MKFSQPTRKKTKEKKKISQTRNELKWENKKDVFTSTFVYQQSSCIKNCWPRTSVKGLRDFNKKTIFAKKLHCMILHLLTINLYLLKIGGF